MKKQTEHPVPEPFTLVGTLLATMRMHRKQTEHFVRQTGLHPTQHRVLMYLSRKGEACLQRELSDHFELTPAAVVQILDKLEGEGYIVRETVEGDNRRKRITLTEKGDETARRSVEAFREIDARFLDGVTDAELLEFYHILLRMQENLKEEERKTE